MPKLKCAREAMLVIFTGNALIEEGGEDGEKRSEKCGREREALMEDNV